MSGCYGGVPTEAMSSPHESSRRQFEPLLDCREAAALLRIHPKTLILMALAGTLPALRFGRLWRFRSSDLDSWLSSRLSCQHHQCR